MRSVYAFSLEDHVYNGSGANQGNTYYYSLAGRLLGAMDANGTTFYLTDALGSILSSFSNTPSSAAVKGTQVFGPYGKARYAKGNINTAKGFTGQYHDSLTGLDYYNARSYDPVAGVFLSADTAQGNMQGMNPYAYVQGNPETYSDPSGRYVVGLGGETYYPGSAYSTDGSGIRHQLNDQRPNGGSCGGTHASALACAVSTPPACDLPCKVAHAKSATLQAVLYFQNQALKFQHILSQIDMLLGLLGAPGAILAFFPQAWPIAGGLGTALVHLIAARYFIQGLVSLTNTLAGEYSAELNMLDQFWQDSQQLGAFTTKLMNQVEEATYDSKVLAGILQTPVVADLIRQYEPGVLYGVMNAAQANQDFEQEIFWTGNTQRLMMDFPGFG